MTNDEVQEIIDRAEDEYDRLKDRVHEQYDEIKRLNNIINGLDNTIENLEEGLEKYKAIIKEQDKELELERKSRQLLTDDLAKVCKISLKKDNIIKEVREYIGIDEELRKVCTNYDVNGIDILEILDKENI